MREKFRENAALAGGGFDELEGAMLALESTPPTCAALLRRRPESPA